MKRLQIIFATAFVAALCSGCMDISANINDVTKGLGPDVLNFPGAGTFSDEATQRRTFHFDLDDEDIRDFIDYAELTDFDIFPYSGVNDLSFVKRIEVGFPSGGAGLPALVVAVFDRTAGGKDNTDGSLSLAPSEKLDIAEYLKGDIEVYVDVTFVPPPADWTAEATVYLDLNLDFV